MKVRRCSLPTNHPVNTYPIFKTFLAAILLIRKKGANSRASPTENREHEENLTFVAWMDEMIVIDCPESDGELDRFLSTTQMLRLLLFTTSPSLINILLH